MLYKIVNRK